MAFLRLPSCRSRAAASVCASLVCVLLLGDGSRAHAQTAAANAESAVDRLTLRAMRSSFGVYMVCKKSYDALLIVALRTPANADGRDIAVTASSVYPGFILIEKRAMQSLVKATPEGRSRKSLERLVTLLESLESYCEETKPLLAMSAADSNRFLSNDYPKIKSRLDQSQKSFTDAFKSLCGNTDIGDELAMLEGFD